MLNDKNPLKVLFGKDGFLFLKNDSNDVISQIKGLKKLSVNQLKIWQNEIEKRLSHAKNNYIYKFIIFPNKHCVYSENLPDDITISNDRPALQLQKLNSSVFLYPLDLFMRERERERERELLYHKTDTHANELAIAIFLNSIAKEINTFPIDYSVYDVEIIGDLGCKCIPPRSSVTKGILYERHSKIIYDNKIRNIGHHVIFESNNKKLPVCCIFGDSFFANFLPLIAEYFHKLYFFHAPVFDIPIIENIKPDIVLNENVERFIYLPDTTSFNDEVIKKIFSTDFNKVVSFINFSFSELDKSNINYKLVYEYIEYINANLKDNNEYHYCKYKFYQQYVYHKKRIFSGKMWYANEKNKFYSWAVCCFLSEKNVLGIKFILHILKNTKIIFSVYEIEENSDQLYINKLKLVKEYTKNLRFKSSAEFEVCFLLNDVELKLGKTYCFVVEGNALLGCGKSYNDLDYYDYMFRGYYRQVGKNFKVVSRNDSIAWWFIYY